MKVIFMRGIPGADKSGWAARMFGGDKKAVILSSADFFNVGNRFVWVGSKTPQSHVWNQRRFEKALDDGMETIVIDNTNIKYWEMRPYLDLLEECPEYYEVFQKCLHIDPVDAYPVSRHKVPLLNLIKMYEAFEEVPKMQHFPF